VRRVTERACHDDAACLLLLRDPSQMGLTVRPAALDDVLDVVVEQDVVNGHADTLRLGALYALSVADIQKRGGYKPRRAREQQAYRLVVTGGVAGTVGVVGLVLAIAGVVGAGLPIVAFIVAAICILLFRRTVAR
jgi:hypothetical protein